MLEFIGSPTQIETPGNVAKIVEEYFGLINSGESRVSIAHVRSPAGWEGPGQCPDFDEFTIVLRGNLQVENREGVTEVEAGKAIHNHRHQWVRYSTPKETGAEYISVCLPAFTRATVHRDF